MAGFLSLDNGLTGILANRRSLDVISQNVANAANPDYSRQQVHLGANRPLTLGTMSVGTGVSVENITRARDSLLDTRYLQENKNLGEYNQLMEVYKEIENALNEPSDEGIRASLSSFTSSMQNLANEPENRGSRRDVVGQGKSLGNEIQRFYRALRSISGSPASAVDAQIDTTLDSINNIGKQIASLNLEINSAEASGTSPNDLLDQRLKLINELSEYADVTVERGMDTHRVNIAGYTLVQGGRTHEFRYEVPRGRKEKKIIYDDKSQSIVRPGGGRLKALMDLKEDKIPGLVDQLNDLTVQFTDRFNDIHRNGFSLDGQTGNDFWAELPTTEEGVYRLEGLTDYGDITTKRAGFITDPDALLASILSGGDEPQNFDDDFGVFAEDGSGNDVGAYSGKLEINGQTFSYDMREDSMQDIIDRINESDNEASAYLSSANRLVITGEQDNDYQIDSLRDTGLLLEKANILTVGGTDRTSQKAVGDVAEAILHADNFAGDARLGGGETFEVVNNPSGDQIEVADGSKFSVGDTVEIYDGVGDITVRDITDIVGNSIDLDDDHNIVNVNEATVYKSPSEPDIAHGTLDFVSSTEAGFSVNYDASKDSLEDVVGRINSASEDAGSNIVAGITDDDRLRIFAGDEHDIQNAPGPGNDVTVELDDVSGLSVGDDIWVSDDNNSEMAEIKSIDLGTNSIVVDNLDDDYDSGDNAKIQFDDPDSNFKVNDTASQQLNDDIVAGDDVEIEVDDVSVFSEGETLIVSDDNNEETAVITNVDSAAGTIEVDNLANDYNTADNAALRRAEGKNNKRNLLTALGMQRSYDKNDDSTEFAIQGKMTAPPRADQVTGLKVDRRIDNNPDLIAAGGGVDQNNTGVADVSNGSGDGSNAYTLSNLTEVPIMNSNDNSTDDFLSSMVAGVGNEASLIYSEQRSSESLVNQIQDRIRSVSSVSLDEEMTNMLRYQQAYQASARVISAARDMADAVFQLV